MDSSDELLRRAEPSALLHPNGIVRSLNDAMASALGRSEEQCVGRYVGELVPDSQRSVVERIVAHARKQSVAMRVLELPRPGGASVVTLVEARPTTATGGEHLVWVHSLNVQNDLGSLLIPFRLSARSSGLGVCAYRPQMHEFEWLGGAASVGALFPEASVPLPWVVRHVHPDDRGSLRRLLTSDAPQDAWTSLRFRSEHGDWYQLACQTRRIQLDYDGPEQVFGMIRDDTQHEAHRKEMLAALGAERSRVKMIAGFSSALITTATEQELQQVVLTRLAATFGGTGAALALVDNERLFVSSDAGLPTWHADTLYCVALDEQRPLSHAIRTGDPQFIPNREELLRRWPHGSAALLPWPGPDAAMSITPLGPAGDRPLGAWVVTYDSEHRPSREENAFVTTLAELAGQALGRIRAQQARVELAAAVQRHMLPTLPERLPGLEVAARYRPCRTGLDIGGDWYDAFLMPDGAVALEIGDAQGHDVDAAAFMGQVRGSLRAIAAHEPNPGTVLTNANQLLVEMDAPRFASCTMLHIDPRDGQVTGASAGHVPLMCAHDDGSHDIRRLPGGPVLGILPDADYPQEAFTLAKDTTLVMVTDGVVEGPDLSLDAGLKRTGTLAAQALRDGLSAEETADRILDGAMAMKHADDLAVLVVRRT
ncbi:SpoIIE family protein phosphatase [Streptomyces chiangmaiensis]|uniref:SpoIIE family protein phosphatase n=1 Tax=Streptomyces chiangmaiensis TaxID=766497 RepID=A0ABU7FT59_9ACTN|nr:SpoIIE family protein phosphatase [Streptomyces chiangmaiensis]MED7827310.1 SpoIIE family protein phosphatase [Streptomyces chiangmaiensis]